MNASLNCYFVRNCLAEIFLQSHECLPVYVCIVSNFRRFVTEVRRHSKSFGQLHGTSSSCCIIGWSEVPVAS